MKAFDYAASYTLSEALKLLGEVGGQARPLAGGTDLLVLMKYYRCTPSLLVDVKGIPELNRLEFDREGLHLGAAVPLATIAAHPRLRQEYPALAQACSLIGSVQVRNRASLGGNLCNAAPSADGAPPLLCLEAQAIIASSGGQRVVPVEDFFLGPGETALAPGELLVEVVVPPPPPGSHACYMRFTPRYEMDIAVAGAGCLLALDREGRCLKARIALAAVAPTPLRAREAEAVLEGERIGEGVIRQASLKAAQAARPISDVRGSAEYRRHLVEVLTRRSLTACGNAREGGQG